jgi:cytosine/adenosine deaminase-related metal-dependent hydrolase
MSLTSIKVGLTGDDVVLAHCVHLVDEEIEICGTLKLTSLIVLHRISSWAQA